MAIDKNYNRELEYHRAQEAGVEANEIGRDTLQKQHNQQEMLRDTAKKIEDICEGVDRVEEALDEVNKTWFTRLANKLFKFIYVGLCKVRRYAMSAYEMLAILIGMSPAKTLVETHCTPTTTTSDQHCNHSSKNDFANEEDTYLGRTVESFFTTPKEESHVKSMEEDVPFNGTDVFFQDNSDSVYDKQKQNVKKILTTVKDHKVIVDSQLKTLQDNESLDSLGEAIENVDHKLNVVNRQMNAKSSFFKGSERLVYCASIEHIDSGHYLAIDDDDSSQLFLSKALTGHRCLFVLHKRGEFFGLKQEHTRAWVGINRSGNLLCNAKTFGCKEEWVIDGNDWFNTHLVATGANADKGGYLSLDANGKPIVGGYDRATKARAPKWRIRKYSKK